MHEFAGAGRGGAGRARGAAARREAGDGAGRPRGEAPGRARTVAIAVALGVALAASPAGAAGSAGGSGAAGGTAAGETAAPGAAGAAAPGEERVSLGQFIRAGGVVGYVILFLSFAGFALVIDSFIHLKPAKLVPPMLVEQLVQMGRQGRFQDVRNLCLSVDCLLARVIENTFAQGRMSLADAREVIEEQGTREITRLHQWVGYIGFIAAVAPMLGLLGTVTGMIDSFNVLGTAKGAAPPEDLARGVAEALVTTCMGLIVALPLMFFHAYFRDRVTRIGQEAAGACDRLMRALADSQRLRAGPAPEAPEAAEAPGGEP